MAKLKLSPTISRNFQIKKIRKLENNHGGMVKIEADGVKETLQELEKQSDFQNKINSAKRKRKNKEEMEYETSKAIALFKEMS